MPWKVTHIMDQKLSMITDHLSGNYNPTELARIYRVSRKTIYKWIKRYNTIRSNEALQNQVPADVYRPSHRSFPSKLDRITYDTGFCVRTVRHSGQIKWQGRLIYLSQVLAKQLIGFKQISQRRWSVYYSFYLLGYWNQSKQRLEPVKPEKRIDKARQKKSNTLECPASRAHA